MATLADTLSEVYEHRVPRAKCGIALLLAQLDDKDRAAAITALDDEAVKPAAVSKWLSKHGHNIAPNTIRRHRRRINGEGCSCPVGA